MLELHNRLRHKLKGNVSVEDSLIILKNLLEFCLGIKQRALSTFDAHSFSTLLRGKEINDAIDFAYVMPSCRMLGLCDTRLKPIPSSLTTSFTKCTAGFLELLRSP